ncbi:hypothetical protein CR513_50068, partial [Mucuna pruriens]
MTICFGACHIDMYDIIGNRSYIPHKEDGTNLPRSLCNEDQKMRCLLNSKARNFIMHSLIDLLPTKVHLRVKYFKISMLIYKYKLFKMEDHDTIDKMFRPQVTTLRVSKDLKKLLMEELLDTLKVDEIELIRDESQRKGKSKTFKDHHPTPLKLKILQMKSLKKKVLMRMISPSYLERSTPYGRRNDDLNGKNTRRSSPKRPMIRVKCKKPKHFKFECPNMENEKEKKKSFFKKKKGLMVTWKDLDLSSLEERYEEANFCFMIVTTFENEEDDGEFGHLSYDCGDCPKKRPSKTFRTNKKGPKTIWIPKNLIILIADLLDSKKDTPIMIGKIGKHHFPSIDNVLYVEGLKHNPLSMNQLCESGCDVSFNKGEYIVKYIDGSLLFSTKRQNNFYRVNLIDLLDQNKLGHASLILISKLSKHHLVRALPNLIFKSNFLMEPLKLLHIDMFGPSKTTSISGEQYGLVVVDDY